MNKLKCIIAAILIYNCFCMANANDCSYAPAMVQCHNDPGASWPTCCGPWYKVGCVLPNITLVQWGVNGTHVRNPSTGMGPSCGAGKSATDMGTPFTGTCGWSEYGSDCGVPYGPSSQTGDYTAYPCAGSCG